MKKNNAKTRKNVAMRELKTLLNKLAAIDSARDPILRKACRLGRMLGIEIPGGEVA